MQQALTVSRTEIGGPDSVPPGQSVQLVATAFLSDGTSRDVTAETAWESHNGALMSISRTGLVTASDQRGEGDIIARYTGLPAVRRGAEFASRKQFVLPVGTYRLYGFIKDEDVYLNGVRVELTAGPAAGMAVTANGFFYFYGVSGETEIRVSKEGYETQIRRTLVSSHQTEAFQLAISAPRPVVDGTYTLRISAAAECRASLPESTRARVYTVVLSQSGARLTGALEAARITMTAPYYPSNAFSGTVEPKRVLFTLSSYGGDAPGDFYPPSLLEEISPAPPSGERGPILLTIYGSVVAAATGNGYTGTLNGAFEVLITPGHWEYGSAEQVSACVSASHPVDLLRDRRP